MTSRTDDRVPRHAPGARLTTSGGGGVVSSSSRRGAALNPLALAIWELCDGTTRPTEMEDAVVHLFHEDPETVRAAVRCCLQDLTAEGLLEWGPPEENR